MRTPQFLSLVLLLSLLTIPGKAFAQHTSVDSYDDASAKLVLDAANVERQRSGLPPLELNSHLSDAAKIHVLEVAKHGEILNQFPGEMDLNQRITLTEVGAAAVGENIAINSDLNALIERLAANPVTREHLLDAKYTDVGAAVLKHDGRYFVVQDFAEALSKIGLDELESIVIKAIQDSRVNRKIMPLKLVPTKRLRTIACAMAKEKTLKRSQVDPSELGMGSGVSVRNLQNLIINFTVIQPKDLPAAITKMTADPTITNFSVGACRSSDSYYVSAVFYFDIHHDLR